MSQTISLIEYELCDEGRLCEDASEVIESVFISTDLLGKIRENIKFTEKKIYEEPGSDESSLVDCIDKSDVHSIKELLENEFIKLIEADDIKNLKTIISPDHIYESIEQFRTLTNVYHILWLKLENFTHKDNALIKLG